MFRSWAALLLALPLASGPATGALAQTGLGPAAPAPAVDPGTKLAFPQSLGGATQMASSSLGAGGTSYTYVVNKMSIVVSVFDNGHRVPTGSDTLPLMNQFTIELNEALDKVKSAGYTQVERPTVASTCAYANMSFRCLTYSVAGARGRMFSRLLMTGYHDHFLKIRIDWAQMFGQTSADAETALKSFVPALMHSP